MDFKIIDKEEVLNNLILVIMCINKEYKIKIAK